MKRRILASVLTVMIVVRISCLRANADDVGLIKMYATAYCLSGITASNKPVRNGICATGHKEWVGKTAILYQRLPDDSIGEIIGIYEIEDTGCKPSVIDVWRPTLDECQEFMNRVYEDGCRGRVYAQVLDAEG